MNGKEIFKIWAPTNAKWTPWVRPVPFIEINDDMKIHEYSSYEKTKIYYVDEYKEDTAYIIDLPGGDSIEEGIALAEIGYRPIPIFNGTNEQENSTATMDNHLPTIGLIWGAEHLKNMNLSENAAPAFLTDTTRLNRRRTSLAVFDNSWDVYAQDLPTAEYFLNNGIKNIVVRSRKKIRIDLRVILYKYQKKGLTIYFTDGIEDEKLVKIRKPRVKEDI